MVLLGDDVLILCEETESTWFLITRLPVLVVGSAFAKATVK
jgi:hypothetical protein